MNNGQDAVVIVHEERAMIRGVEVANKRVIAATDGGVVAYEISTVQAAGGSSGNNNPRPALSSYPQQQALPAPTGVVIADPPERDCTYYCFSCDNEYQWYNLKGKGICWVLLLLLFYLVVLAILLPIAVLGYVLWCCSLFREDD